MDYLKKKFIISIILIIILNISLVTGIILLFRNLNQKMEKITNNKKEIYLLEQRNINTKKLETILSKTAGKAEKIKNLFLNQDNLVNFIKELEYLAKKTNLALEMKSLSTSSKKGEKPRFNFKLEGNFPNIYQYLLLLEKIPYQIEGDKIYIQKPKEKNYWEANIELKLLTYKQ